MSSSDHPPLSPSRLRVVVLRAAQCLLILGMAAYIGFRLLSTSSLDDYIREIGAQQDFRSAWSKALEAARCVSPQEIRARLAEDGDVGLPLALIAIHRYAIGDDGARDVVIDWAARYPSSGSATTIEAAAVLHAHHVALRLGRERFERLRSALLETIEVRVVRARSGEVMATLVDDQKDVAVSLFREAEMTGGVGAMASSSGLKLQYLVADSTETVEIGADGQSFVWCGLQFSSRASPGFVRRFIDDEVK